MSSDERDELDGLRRQVRRLGAQQQAQRQAPSVGAASAIRDALERQLEHHQFHEISVAAIAKEAGVSRAAFYLHYSAKEEVMIELLERVFAEIVDVVEPWVTKPPADPPQHSLRVALTDAFEIWGDHWAVLQAAHEQWPMSSAIEQRWLTVMNRFRDLCIAKIESERVTGHAPPGPPANQIAIGLIWASERILYISTKHTEPQLPSPNAAVDVLLALWIPAIYGTPTPPTGPS